MKLPEDLAEQEIPAMAIAGKIVLTENIKNYIITGVCIYTSLHVFYGICHALSLTATTKREKAFWAELREYFTTEMYPHN